MRRGQPLVDLLDRLSHVLFGVIAIIMRFAPIGAFGAMAFTIGKYGVGTLVSLGTLMLCVYITCFLFVFIVLGLIARVTGFSLWLFLRYIKEEILIVLGTSSSEAALPRMITKLENAGCSKSVVGLVIPTGYSFNLDGTSIYLTMAAIFIAQATNIPLSLADQLGILGVLLLTSKGAAAVTGGGFITLAATLESTSKVPVAGLALLLGVDRLMSEARAITNLIGNGVATMVVARWEGALDLKRARAVLAEDSPGGREPEALAEISDEPAYRLPPRPWIGRRRRRCSASRIVPIRAFRRDSHGQGRSRGRHDPRTGLRELGVVEVGSSSPEIRDRPGPPGVQLRRVDRRRRLPNMSEPARGDHRRGPAHGRPVAGPDPAITIVTALTLADSRWSPRDWTVCHWAVLQDAILGPSRGTLGPRDEPILERRHSW